MPSQEDIEEQQKLLQAYRVTLSHYLRQRAIHSTAFEPPTITHGVFEACANIRRIKVILKAWGVGVDDHPDDEADAREEPIRNVPALPPASEDASGRVLRVFLCHASDDKSEVRKLYERLRVDGVYPWLDEEDLLPGQDWEKEIPKAVNEADVVIVCLSNNSIKKDGYIQEEIRYALNAADEKKQHGEIYIIPLRIEECTVPKRLDKWQWVNLFERKGYEKLMRSLRARASSLGVNILPLAISSDDPGIMTDESPANREFPPNQVDEVEEEVSTEQINQEQVTTLSLKFPRSSQKRVDLKLRKVNLRYLPTADVLRVAERLPNLLQEEGAVLLKMTAIDELKSKGGQEE